MFDDEDYLKQKFRDFLKDEIEELQQHKLRFFALFFSLLISLALFFMEDNTEIVEISDTSQVEKISDVAEEENIKTDKKTSNKKVISVEKDSNESKREKIVAVLGANSDKLYIGDPFQAEEEPLPEIQQKSVEIASVPQQIPIIPPELPPIPDQIQNLPPIPSVVPQITEPIKTAEQEFILTGTAINFDKKSAVVQKISTVQGKSERVENLIISVGDSLEGHQIVDITPSAVLFDDGHRINSNYLGSNISVVADEKNIEIEDISVNYVENPKNPVSIPDPAIPVIPDIVVENIEELPEENDSKIPDMSVENNILVEDIQNPVQVDDKNSDLNSSTTDNLTEFDSEATDIYTSVDEDINTSTNNADVPFNIQANSFALGNNSP